jgi:signal transduction histidine kinase
VWVPGGAALLAYLAAVMTTLRGEPPTWLLHGLFVLLTVTPIGFLVTVARSTLTELRASRARILDTADAERRRIERDLHDGVQQHLVSAAILLDLLGHRADSTEVAHMLGQARMILADARTELRHLCHHIYPTALTDSGLDTALAELVWHVPLPVELRGRAGSLPRATAATAYYVAAEAVTNAVKHAGADRLDIHVVRGARRLRITVADNGRGGADPARGTGLRGLGDRVEAAGGRLVVRTGRTGGTVVEASMPCVS